MTSPDLGVEVDHVTITGDTPELRDAHRWSLREKGYHYEGGSWLRVRMVKINDLGDAVDPVRYCLICEAPFPAYSLHWVGGWKENLHRYCSDECRRVKDHRTAHPVQDRRREAGPGA